MYVSEFDHDSRVTNHFSPSIDNQISSLSEQGNLSERELFKLQMRSPSIKKNYKVPMIYKAPLDDRNERLRI